VAKFYIKMIQSISLVWSNYSIPNTRTLGPIIHYQDMKSNHLMGPYHHGKHISTCHYSGSIRHRVLDTESNQYLLPWTNLVQSFGGIPSLWRTMEACYHAICHYHQKVPFYPDPYWSNHLAEYLACDEPWRLVTMLFATTTRKYLFTRTHIGPIIWRNT